MPHHLYLGRVKTICGVQAKCSLGDEVRQLHLSASTSYAELLDAVRAKFPAAGPFVIKYVDKYVLYMYDIVACPTEGISRKVVAHHMCVDP
jgi:hypothetical protein